LGRLLYDELIHASADWLFRAKEVRNLCNQLRTKDKVPGGGGGGAFHITTTGVLMGNFEKKK